jgi:hypothetical protein
LGASHVLASGVRNVAEAVGRLAEAQQAFARDYDAFLRKVLGAGLPTAVCTIYDTPRWASDHVVMRTGICLFNDIITRAAFSRGLPLIDLRLICDQDEDYANPIEPSAHGGDKIAAAIARLATGHGSGSVVITGSK